MRLAGFERRWAATIARALVPADALAGVGVDLGSIDLGARYAAEHDGSPWQPALLLRFALWLIGLWPLPRVRTFGGLDEAARAALLERLLKDRRYVVRMTAMMFKLVVCSLLFGDESTLQRIGAYKLEPRSLVRHKEAS